MTLRVALLGCGNRGADVYGLHLRSLGVEIAALIDSRPARLQEVARRFGVPEDVCFSHWDEFFALGRVADAVVIATPDDQHVEPCVQALALGYHVLQEKPVCLDESDIQRLLAAEAQSAGRVTVCHVLRATPFFQDVRRVLDSGVLGQVVGIQWAENVAWWHYAHSYVRGNWRESPPAAPFILAKSGHDLDLLRWFADSPPLRVSSEGGLHHFRPENAPTGASGRCVTCPVTDCPFDARRIYPSRPLDVWPNTVLTAGGLSLADALEHGPYGECVYLGRNDVVDHQGVTVAFQNGVKAQLTVSAFTHNNTRTFKLLGSRGELRGQMELGELQRHDFVTGETSRWTVETAGNHGGGDFGLTNAWVRALLGETEWPSPLSVSLASHRMAFAAERSRLSQTVELI